MQILTSKPPKEIYYACVSKFGVSFDTGTVFTVGDTIYAKHLMPEHLVVHEKTHIKQQKKYGTMAWWAKYLESDEFRLEQELQAYRNQYRWAKKNIKSRDDRAKLLRSIALDLSGTMYGNIISYQEAVTKILNGS